MRAVREAASARSATGLSVRRRGRITRTPGRDHPRKRACEKPAEEPARSPFSLVFALEEIEFRSRADGRRTGGRKKRLRREDRRNTYNLHFRPEVEIVYIYFVYPSIGISDRTAVSQRSRFLPRRQSFDHNPELNLLLLIKSRDRNVRKHTECFLCNSVHVP